MHKYIGKKIRNYKFNKVISTLKNTPSERLKRYGENLVIPTFKRIAKKTPAFAKIYKDANLDISSIKNLEDFKKVPVLQKEDLFTKFEVEDLCVNGNLDGIKLLMTSSGFSGIFSYGIITQKDEDKISLGIDTCLHYGFDILNKKTFMINSLPMGVKFNTCLPMANTSVRVDMALSCIDFAIKRYEQVLLVSDPHFIKYLIETGIDKGIDWKKLNISFILGEDWFSNSFSNYLLHQIGGSLEDSKSKQILNTLGVTELDLNMFHGSRYTNIIRDVAQKNEKLREDLFGKGIKSVPEFMHYYPHRTYLELIEVDNNGYGELIYTMLSPVLKMPFVRYNSKDTAKLFSYKEVEKILLKHGYDNLIPDLKLPFVAIYTRKGKYVEVDGIKVAPEDVKEVIYRDFDVASSITGYFRLSYKNDEPVLEIQMREKHLKNKDLDDKINKLVKDFVGANIKIIVYDYEKFPYSMKLDYETKFKCI